jgi:hypothetical protein
MSCSYCRIDEIDAAIRLHHPSFCQGRKPDMVASCPPPPFPPAVPQPKGSSSSPPLISHRSIQKENLLLHGLVIEGADDGVDIEILGTIAGHGELRQSSYPSYGPSTCAGALASQWGASSTSSLLYSEEDGSTLRVFFLRPYARYSWPRRIEGFVEQQ